MQQIHRVGEKQLHQSSDSLPLKANPVITLFQVGILGLLLGIALAE